MKSITRQNMPSRDLRRIQNRDRVPGAKGPRYRWGHCNCFFCAGEDKTAPRTRRERKAMKYEQHANED